MASEVNRNGSARDAGTLKALAGTLGVLQQSPRAYLQGAQGGSGLDEASIAAAITERDLAKQAKNYAEADRIRKGLFEQGVVLKDSASGTTWVRA